MNPAQAFDAHHEAVYRFAYRLTRRQDIAEDITQECFLALVRAPGKFDPARGGMRTWLFAMARNLAWKHYRDHAVEEMGGNENAPAVFVDPDISAAVEQAVGALPQLQREALILFEYEGATLAEIAEVVRADVGTVKSRLHRAREAMRCALAPYRGTRSGHGAV